MNASIADTSEFSPTSYAALIEGLRARGYATRGYADADPAARHLILRHDVDFSIDAAQTMAEHEAELGLRSAYFVLLRTEFYNVLSGAGLAAIARMAALGHAIGLHFDAALYEDGRAEIDSAAKRECDILASVIGHPVELVSLHRPGPIRSDQPARLGGRLNAYGRRFVRDMGYCSDSRGGWHHGHPLVHPAIESGRALQLLVHPFWWQAPALPPADRLRRFLRERAAFLDRELARHCTVHKSTV